MVAGVILFNLSLNFKKVDVEPVQKISKDLIQLNLEKLKLKFGF